MYSGDFDKTGKSKIIWVLMTGAFFLSAGGRSNNVAKFKIGGSGNCPQVMNCTSHNGCGSIDFLLSAGDPGLVDLPGKMEVWL